VRTYTPIVIDKYAYLLRDVQVRDFCWRETLPNL